MPAHSPTHSCNALMPRYAADFQCIGSACEDTCCAGWKISIDQATLETYRQVKHPGLAERFQRFIKPISVEARGASGHPARIELLPDTRDCPFLEQGCCAIHRDLGEDYLSDTCASFPRRIREVSGQIEYALDLACPEAARKALLTENVLDLIESPISIRPSTLVASPLTGKLTPQQVSEIRGFCLQFMQLGDLLLWQRLVVIGHFCHQLEALLATDTPLDLDQFLSEFLGQIEQGPMLALLNEVTADHWGQAQLFFKLWQGGLKRMTSPTHTVIQEAVAAGLCTRVSGMTTPDWEALVSGYQAGLQHMPGALQAAPALLDNYLLNEMFREAFPFGMSTPYRHFLGVLARFGVLRLMLAAVCNSTPLPDPARLASTAQVFSRLYPHPSFSTQAIQALEYLGFDKPERFPTLLRS
ncbi:MAG: flagellin lysine-N-methylase [Zoogloeaceae bacterium]|nr:flagellin lysine-N-methylase [Zoogloeaceae bacterium]